MSVSRIIKKRQQSKQNSQQSYSNQSQHSNPQYDQQTQYSTTNHNKNQQSLQTQYQQYLPCYESNPSSYQFSSSFLPNSASLQSSCRLPISLFLPAVSYQKEPQPKCIDSIPRCGACRAYMTYYNKIEKRGFSCFVCGKENLLPSDYVVDAENVELNQVSYHVMGGQSPYTQPLKEHSMVFLIDINVSSYETKLLYYTVACMKQVLSREQHDDTLIFFYTYDDVIHEYDFTGDEVSCLIIDPSINMVDGSKSNGMQLSTIREKLFHLLDQLEEISANNKKTASNFFNAMTYVVESVKHTFAKMFIFQSNQAVAGEQFMNQYYKKPNSQSNYDNPNKPRSLIDTKNKQFFNKFSDPMIKQSISFSMFIFQRNFKNLRVFADMAKITGSQLMMYRKDVQEDLLKFYYDFSHLLGATYYDDVRIEFIISPGWYFSAVYSNSYRLKEQGIVFKICQYESSRRICVTFLPQQYLLLPYCSLQVISHYIYNKQHFVAVNTCVLPLTSSLQKLYLSQNYTQLSATLHKIAISGLRSEEINIHRNKTVKQLAILYKAAMEFYKKNIPYEIMSLILGCLGILKSAHFQLDSINDTIVLDSVISQRCFLQGCGVNEIQSVFSPYLFSLSLMTEEMCQSQSQQFVYPQVCELKFASVKQGMFLMDNGFGLYLYISKVCEPQLLGQLFGKQKFSKNEVLTEQSLLNQTYFAQQVTSLISACRQQKSSGWVPLYIVRWGENSLNEKMFYMNFYEEKYDEFRTFKMTLGEFMALLGQQY